MSLMGFVVREEEAGELYLESVSSGAC